MTVGQRIQYYRKLQGLSQEELGQKLLVSRQTVSLWENDQTLPTIDNLVRLKEIFGVTIDEILTEQSPEEPVVPQPLERYAFTYTAEEVEAVHNMMLSPMKRRAIIGAGLCALVGIVVAISGSSPGVAGFMLACALLCAISNGRAIKQARNAWKTTASRVTCGEYIYEIYEESISVSVLENGTMRTFERIPMSAIEHIWQYDRIIVLQALGRLFFLREEAMQEGTGLHAAHRNMPDTCKEKPKRDYLQKWSIALFVATLLCLHGALLGVALLSGANGMFVENMWTFFVLLPIPVASIVFGILLKKRGYKWKKNVIAGAIIAFFLTIYGSFTFIFSGVFDHSDRHILAVERYTGIDIPKQSFVSTQDWNWGEENDSQSPMYYTSEIHFEDVDIAEFEASMRRDSRWQPVMKTELKGLRPVLSTYREGCYTLMYNIDEREYNTVPTQSGTYHFLCIFYDMQENIMYIEEYSIEYVK